MAAQGKALTIGATYPIEERDALKEMQARAGQVNWKEVLSRDPSQWSALESVRLPIAKLAAERSYIPYYTTEMDIPDKDGRIVYPKGFRFNPLQFMKMPWRVVVIGDRKEEMEWARTMIKPGDMVLTAGGDVRALTAKLKQPVFIFDPRMTQRLGVGTVPSIVEQRGTNLVIREFYVKSD